jgi:hypothetical protein
MSGLNKSQGQLVRSDGGAMQATDADLGSSGKLVKGHIASAGGVTLGKAFTHLIGCGAAGAAGSTTYQAEEASMSGGAAENRGGSGWNGTGFTNFPRNGGVLEFTNVDGGAGGDATMTVRYGLAYGSRTADLSVNGSNGSLVRVPEIGVIGER